MLALFEDLKWFLLKKTLYSSKRVVTLPLQPPLSGPWIRLYINILWYTFYTLYFSIACYSYPFVTVKLFSHLVLTNRVEPSKRNPNMANIWSSPVTCKDDNNIRKSNGIHVNNLCYYTCKWKTIINLRSCAFGICI